MHQAPRHLRYCLPACLPALLQAREQLRVVTVICANRAYAILKVELARERITPRWGQRAPALVQQTGAMNKVGILKPDWPCQGCLPPHACPAICSNGRAARTLTEIGSPAIDWVSLGQGMGVPASRATTCEELAAQLTAALERAGPSLIEAML